MNMMPYLLTRGREGAEEFLCASATPRETISSHTDDGGR